MRIFRKYYIAVEPTGSDDANAAASPKGNAATTPQQRTEWNGFLDYLDKKGVAGKPDLDAPGAGLKYFQQYKKANPDVSITPDNIATIQNEQQQIRNGGSIGNLGTQQMDYLRQGLSDSYLNKPVPAATGQIDQATSKLYYPTAKTADTDHGTDIEGYYNAKVGLAPTTSPVAGIEAPVPSTATAIPITGAPAPPVNANLIPRPDYDNPASRTTFLQNWQKKYGSLEGRGDTVLKVNETPRGASDTAKNITTKIAKQFGLDPALLYSSSMEEGMSGLFKDKSGLDTKHRKPGDFGYQDDFGNKEFPINGNQSFGLPDFYNRFPELVKGGYLPKEFASRFKGGDAENNFKTTDDALKAKAALMKYTYDDVDKYATKVGVTLSPKAKDFFALAEFNAGEGGFHKLLKEYQVKGLLENDQFLKENPHKGEKIPENQDIYAHVIRRLKMRDNLKEQQLFN